MARDAAGSIHCGSFIEEKLFRNGVALGLSDCSLSAKTNTLLAPCLGSHRRVAMGVGVAIGIIPLLDFLHRRLR